MTVVGDERVPTGGEENQQKKEDAGLFYRICCCCSTSEKEPPVQLIRSGSLTYQQGGQTTTESQPQISAVNDSIDDDDNDTENENKPKNDENKEEDDEGFNVNDILMDGVIKNAEEDKTETLEEDVTSISTDVVQEVDESDLQKALEPSQKTSNDSNEFVKPLKGRKATITNEDSVSIQSHQDEDNRKMSVIEFIRSEADVIEKQEVPPKPARDPEVTRSEISDSSEEEEAEFKNPEFKEATLSLSEEEDEDDEISSPPPLPLEPPPRLSSSLEMTKSPIPPPRSPRQSKMYENADESETSEEEDEETPPASGLSKMQPVTFAPSPKPIDSSSESSESSISSDEEEGEKEVEQLGVTRISVKSNGQAQIHSPRSPVSVSLDADRQIVTDDEFSEKLI